MSITIESPTRYCTNKAIEYMINKYCPKSDVAILDVGCGKGEYYQYFTSQDIKGTYLGIDVKQQESWQTREENGLQIAYSVHDAEKLQDLNRKFNYIISIQSLEHILNDAEAIKNMMMCLDEGGYITLTVPSKYSFFIYYLHGYRKYSLRQIKRLANNNGLCIVETVKLGGLTSLLLHFILWTFPAIILGIEIWKYYKKSKFITDFITRLEWLSLYIDKILRFLEGGYAITLKRRAGDETAQ